LETKIKIGDEDEKGIQRLKDQVGLEEKKYNVILNAFDSLTNSNNDLDKLALERAKKAREDALKSETAFAEQRLLLSKKNTAEELRFQIEAIRAKTKEELSDVNLTTGEKAKILAQEQKDIETANKKFRLLQFQNEKDLMQARLTLTEEGSAEELDLKIGIINQTAAIEIAQEGVTADKRAKIRADERKQIADLTKKYNLDTLSNEINTTISTINTKLNLVREGDIEELNLKKQLVDQKQLLDLANATAQIKNEKLLAAKVGEINSKAIADKRKLDDDFTEHQLQNSFKVLERQTQLNNLNPNAVIGDPTSSNQAKNAAQSQILENAKTETFTKILKIDQAIKVNAGNVNKLLEQREDLYNKLLEIIKQIENQGKKTEQDRINALIEAGNAVADAFGKLSGIGELFNSELGESIKKMAQLGKNAADVGKAIKAYKDASVKDATGKTDTAGQITALSSIAGLVVGVIQSVIQGIKKSKQDKKDAEEAVNIFNSNLMQGELVYQALLRDRARIHIEINKLTLDGLKAQKQLIDQQKQANSQAFDDVLKQLQGETFVSGIKRNKNSTAENIVKSLFGDPDKAFKEIRESLAGKSFDELEKLFVNNQLTGKAKDLFEQLQKLKSEGADLDAILEENKQKAAEIFTGTTSDAILDKIVDGFRNGLHSAADFASSFEDLMRGAMINALKFQYLEGPLKDFFAKFAESSQSDGQLTSQEIDQLHKTFNDIISNANSQFQQLQQISGLDLNSSNQANALIGGIKGVTEQTAELLAGQFGGMRINIIDQLNVAKQCLTAQLNIENNTALTATRIQQLLQKFDAYESGTKSIHIN
jgi:hypothetical protein